MHQFHFLDREIDKKKQKNIAKQRLVVRIHT